MKRLILLVLGLVAALTLVPSAAVADSAAHTYMLEMEGPNFGTAANGDMVTITGHAAFRLSRNANDGPAGMSITSVPSGGSQFPPRPSQLRLRPQSGWRIFERFAGTRRINRAVLDTLSLPDQIHGGILRGKPPTGIAALYRQHDLLAARSGDSR